MGLTVWVGEPDVTHWTSWHESTYKQADLNQSITGIYSPTWKALVYRARELSRFSGNLEKVCCPYFTRDAMSANHTHHAIRSNAAAEY